MQNISWNVHRFVVLTFLKDSLGIKLPYMFLLLTQGYGFAGVVSFAIVCWLISFHIDQLREKINNFFTSSIDDMHLTVKEIHLQKTSVESALDTWKEFYINIIETISCVQDCFGPFLFLWISLVFVNLVNNSFFLMIGLLRFGFDLNETWEFFVFLIRSLINLFVLTVSPVILDRKV